MGWQEYIDFVDIGGLTDSTYHNVFFRKYDIINENGEDIVVPILDFDFFRVDAPTAKNAKDLLVDLLGLYNKMTTLSEEETNAAIIDWCIHNVHPYNTDKLNNLFQDESGTVDTRDIMTLARFSLSAFKTDLIALGTHFNYYYALEKLHWGNATEAMNLFKKYDGWSEYSCFEKYKKKAFQEAKGDDKKATALFKQYVDADSITFQRILVNKFHSFKLTLMLDPKTNQPVHHISVDSIFDIVWFAFSKFIAQDASYVDFEDQNYFDDFADYDGIPNKTLPITRCPICGDYIKRVKNKKYCNKPECQKQRNALKSRNYYLKKKQDPN